MRMLLAFMVGVAVGAGGLWYLGTNSGRAHVDAASAQIENAARATHEGLEEKIHEWRLSPQDIKDELARTGQVVRRKAVQAGRAIADAAADGRVTAAVKAKILVNRELTNHDIGVSTTAGSVSLSGTVASAEELSKTMALAMDTDGVREVVSKLVVAPPAARK